MNITLVIDKHAVERAREVARQQGTSLNALIREYVELLASQVTGDELVTEFQALWAEADKGPGSGRGFKFDREQLYEDRLGRYKTKHG